MGTSLLLQKAKSMLENAKDLASKDRTNESLQSVDQALELSLRDACMTAGCTDATAQDGKPFAKWGVTDYIRYLDAQGRITEAQKHDFFEIHNWRNPVQHVGIMVHPAQVNQAIKVTEDYIRQLERSYSMPEGLPSLEDISNEPIDEVKDILPIFRATPDLIAPGLRLIAGEKLLPQSMKRIDLELSDTSKNNVFVEVKWNSANPQQAIDYQRLVKASFPSSRIIWLVPNDIKVTLPQGIERISYDRSKFTELVFIRRRARQVINHVLGLLTSPFTPPRSIMYQMEYTFPCVMSACYFDGEIKTDSGTHKIGLRKQAVGRYLDILKSICESQWATETPELIVLFLREMLVAPYYIEMRGGVGRVVEGGFYQDMADKEKMSTYRGLSSIVLNIHKLITDFCEKYRTRITDIYPSVQTSDILYRVLNELPQDAFEMGDRIIIKKLLSHVVSKLGLKQTPPVSSIHHSVVNKDIKNVVQSGYEMDMARRIVELAVLKQELICVSGVPVVQVLRREVFRGKPQYVRVNCQNFRLNSNIERVQYLGA